MQRPVHGEAEALSGVVHWQRRWLAQRAAGMGRGRGFKSNLGCYRGQALALVEWEWWGGRCPDLCIRSWGESGATLRWGGWSRFGIGGLCRWVEN